MKDLWPFFYRYVLINNGFCLFKVFQASWVLSVGLTITILFLIESRGWHSNMFCTLSCDPQSKYKSAVNINP